jgi:hypothetical protein
VREQAKGEGGEGGEGEVPDVLELHRPAFWDRRFGTMNW